MSKLISTTTFILLTSLSSVCYSQNHEESNKPETVLTAPDNWQEEIIPFPLGFARSIDYVGFEDLRFAPKWSDSTHQNFWTYAFVWYIDPVGPMSTDQLTEDFNAYYDGLMGIDDHNQQDTAQVDQMAKTVCLFIKTKEGFTGKMYTYDRFFTKKYITLNILVEESLCEKAKKQIIRCDISIKGFDQETWKIFEEVKLKAVCE